MPATVEVPSIQDYLDAYAAGVASLDKKSDLHRGSRYDVLGGVAAVLFHRISLRDRGQFRATYFDAAQDIELDQIIAQRFPDISPRIVATAGAGVAVLSRLSAALGAGTLLEGTRIQVAFGGSTPVKVYEVAVNTPVDATALRVPVPVRASVKGSGQAISVTQGEGAITIEDSLWDNSWSVEALDCSDGTDREKDDTWRTRTRDTRLSKRIGYVSTITRAMVDAGATQVALFASDFAGDDFGLNRVFVGDAGFVSSPELLLACRIAAYGATVLGTAVQVLPMTPVNLTATATLTLWSKSDRTGRDVLRADVRGALLNYFESRKSPFLWRADAAEGAVFRAARQNAQSVSLEVSESPPDIATLFDVIPLNAWQLRESDITVEFA